MTLFYGMQDVAVNYVGGAAAAAALEWPGALEFRSRPLQPLVIGGVSTGQTRPLGKLWGSKMCGHRVPFP